MISIEQEIYGLKQDLMFRGVDEYEAEDLSNQARSEIIENVDFILQESMDVAKMAGMQVNADDFVKELRISDYGSMYAIDTLSGKTDFTVPPFSMLPSLLKGGKVAKDGSVYKVIPVKQGGAGNSTVDVMKNINDKRTKARDIKRASSGNTNFRVASSKQDPKTQWQHPGFKRDMTQTLKEINLEMNDRIECMVRDTINRYKGF